MANQHDSDAFRSTFRETLLILLTWGIFCVWVLVYCARWAYLDADAVGDGSEPTVATVMGFPSWVFWGIFVPWMTANLFTVWFCLCYMRDDDEPGDDHA